MESLQQLALGPFVWGYSVSIMPAGCLVSWTGGRNMLGYSHLIMSITSLLTPVAAHLMHSETVVGLRFIAGFFAVGAFRITL